LTQTAALPVEAATRTEAVIRYVRLRFAVTAIDTLGLPPYKGSTLRGAFGAALRRISCALKRKDCDGCLLRQSCAYSYIFETPPPPDASMMRKYTRVPHPYIVEPPDDERAVFDAGESFDFGITLIGRAVEFQPYIVYAVREMGAAGIGKGRGRFRLDRVWAGEYPMYEPDGATIRSAPCSRMELFPPDTPPFPALARVSMELLTPLRIKFGERFVNEELDFHMIIRSMLRRVSAIYEFHEGGDSSGWDFKGLIGQAETVKTVRHDLRWRDWERYSNRQDELLKMGGLVGSASFEGEIGPFMPLLRAAEALHAGKGTVFGLGRVRVIDESNNY
jgi:hypothetical protein